MHFPKFKPNSDKTMHQQLNHDLTSSAFQSMQVTHYQESNLTFDKMNLSHLIYGKGGYLNDNSNESMD